MAALFSQAVSNRVGRLLVKRTMPLPPCAAVARFFALVADNNDPNARLKAPIDDRVRKDAQRKYAAALRDWCAEVRVRDQESCHAFEFVQKPLSDQQACLLRIEIQGVGDVLLGTWVKRICHRASLARRRLMASCPGTSTAEPDSRDASLRSASASQASSTSGSVSRLAIRRSRRCERSAGASFRASASRTSRLVVIVISDAIALNKL